jgi:2-hydroxychromene-2-carboxylate isomerase
MQIDFFWDCGSPYTYLATTQLAAFEKRTGATFRYRPLLLGGLYKTTGNAPPISVAAKARWMLQDLVRWREQYGVPLRLPGESAPFPVVSLVPMRAAVAAEMRGKGREYCHAIFHAYFVEGRDIAQPDEVARVARSIGLDADDVLAAIQTAEVKDRLRANTDEAAARGAFGVPTFFIDEQIFWGNDRFHHLERALA